jgi:hypothetical protein
MLGGDIALIVVGSFVSAALMLGFYELYKRRKERAYEALGKRLDGRQFESV